MIRLYAEWLLRFTITTASACATAGAIFLVEFVRIFGYNFKIGRRHVETNEPRNGKWKSCIGLPIVQFKCGPMIFKSIKEN